MRKLVTIVVPVYNEAENVWLLQEAVQQVFEQLPQYHHQIIFVDDGSSDDTLIALRQMAERFTAVRYLSFSRNFGHQFALKAGLDYADGDCVISMDGDMQHPPELIPAMLEGWEQGNDVVYTIREEDKQLPYGKRQSSKLFYNLLNNLSDIELEEGSADFRLLSSQVVSIIRNLKEYDIFFRGMVKWMGFSQMAIRYQPAERKHGASKYTFKKMVRLALQGITSFSTKPLYIATYLGFFFSAASILILPYVLYSFYFGHPNSGWASVIIAIAFFGGLQLMILGIIGIYLGKLFMQAKQRPQYIIKESNLHGQKGSI